jgi:hypothetical protein
MATDIEFEFTQPARSPGSEEQLDDEASRFRRVPQGVWISAVVAVLVLVMAVDVGRGRSSRPTVSTTPTADISPVVERPHVFEVELELTAIALDSDPLTNVVQPVNPGAACPAPRGGSSPLPVELAMVQRTFPAFTHYESSLKTDTATNLCSVTLRARAQDGSILVVRVIAPPSASNPPETVDDHEVAGPYPVFEGVDAIANRRFRVQVGVLSTGHEFATIAQFAQLADDDALTW